MTAAEKRAKAVSIAKKRYKLNSYTQGSKRVYVGGYPTAGDGIKGFSDCSAFVRWVLKQVLGIDIGYNTSAQIQNRARGTLIEKATAKQTYPTEALMEPVDCVYFKGCLSHAWDVGHVEMYLGNGKCIGHGSGTGPTIKTLKSYSKSRGSGERKYLCVIRWIPDDPEAKLGETLLKMGDENSAVLALQHLLKVLGYDLGAWGANRDGCDGEFGSDTKKAVKAFEEAHGLQADGVADVACIEAIKTAAGLSLGRVRVTGSTVNVRSGPDTSHKVIGVAKADDVLERNGTDTEEWLGVVYGGASAYISAQYTEVI